MPKEHITPEKFLNKLGIKLETTTLVTVINGVMKQPDLCYLLEEYWKRKFAENCDNEIKSMLDVDDEN